MYAGVHPREHETGDEHPQRLRERFGSGSVRLASHDEQAARPKNVDLPQRIVE